jgi:hypothetical protein
MWFPDFHDDLPKIASICHPVCCSRSSFQTSLRLFSTATYTRCLVAFNSARDMITAMQRCGLSSIRHGSWLRMESRPNKLGQVTVGTGCTLERQGQYGELVSGLIRPRWGSFRNLLADLDEDLGQHALVTCLTNA